MPATPFLGRERELADVVELLTGDEVRLVTLTGPGGIGKTRLAVQAGADASDNFPDGVWWVPLAPLREPALVVETVAQRSAREVGWRRTSATAACCCAGQLRARRRGGKRVGGLARGLPGLTLLGDEPPAAPSFV